MVTARPPDVFCMDGLKTMIKSYPKRSIKKEGAEYSALKDEVYRLDMGRCVVCECIVSRDICQMHHRIKRHNRQDTPENCFIVCPDGCHDLAEAGDWAFKIDYDARLRLRKLTACKS